MGIFNPNFYWSYRSSNSFGWIVDLAMEKMEFHQVRQTENAL